MDTRLPLCTGCFWTLPSPTRNKVKAAPAANAQAVNDRLYAAIAEGTALHEIRL
ncbi:hypothetical protein GCM10022221_67730 [Actinocorallia aurea]